MFGVFFFPTLQDPQRMARGFWYVLEKQHPGVLVSLRKVSTCLALTINKTFSNHWVPRIEENAVIKGTDMELKETLKLQFLFITGNMLPVSAKPEGT